MNSLPVPLNQRRETDNSTLRVSHILQQFLADHPEAEIRLRDLLNVLGDRAFGPTLLICALPVAGISALISVPLIRVSGQLVLGFEQPWLPEQLLDHPFPREQSEPVISGAISFLEQLENFTEPR